MRKFCLLFVVLMLLSSMSYGQTFICTDLNYNDYTNMSNQQIQKEKNRGLGSKALLTFYDNSLRLSWTDNKGETTSLILNKVGDNDYSLTERQGKYNMTMRLKLQKIVAYIKSFTIDVYREQSYIGNATFKRK